MKYYISDLHLFHENAIRFDKRPFCSLEQMHETILQRWNERVTNGDFVYILGDVSMRGKNEDLIAFVSRLKGRKVLIRGNHDDVSDYRYQQLFAEMSDYKEIYDSVGKEKYGLVLSHYPIFSWKNMGHGKILLYGHTHMSLEDSSYQKCLSEIQKNDCRQAYDKPLRAFNVGCMLSYMDYTPRTLEEIMKGCETYVSEVQKTEEYDLMEGKTKNGDDIYERKKLHYILMTGYDNCHDGDEWIGIYSGKEELQAAYQKTLHRLEEAGDHEKIYIHAFEENSGKWKYDVKLKEIE